MLVIVHFLHYFFKNNYTEINRQLEKAVVTECDFKRVQNLLKRGANPNFRTGNDNTTLLHCASSAEIAQELLLCGAEVNACDINGETSLSVAVIRGKDVAVVRALLSGGADIAIKTATKETLLHRACTVEVVNELLNHGLEVDAMSSYGYTPLYTAVKEGKDIAVVQALLSAGASVNITLRKDRRNLLHCASDPELIAQLILFGADVNAREIFGQTPLHVAVEEKKKFEVIQTLLKHGANVNSIDSKGNTALVYAISNHHTNFELIKELLKYKADIIIGQFHSPLHRAMQLNPACAELLIKFTLLLNSNQMQPTLFRNIIDADHYSYLFSKLSNFVQDCIHEISEMKTDSYNMGATLFDIAQKKIVRIKPLYDNYKKLKDEIFTKYPIYNDIIWPDIKLRLERAHYIKVLEIITNKYNYRENQGKCVVLNYDCVQQIWEYLSNEDLKNCITAFGQRSGPFICYK